MVCFLTPYLFDHILPVSYTFHDFLLTMIMVYCCVSGVSCSYDLSASQLLELSVSEFCSTVPNSHAKSRVCFRFCHGIAKGGDCKVSTILLALFRAKFACISAFSNPVFRWVCCKGSE